MLLLDVLVRLLCCLRCILFGIIGCFSCGGFGLGRLCCCVDFVWRCFGCEIWGF